MEHLLGTIFTNNGTLAMIITALIAILSMIGGLWAKIRKVLNAVKEVSDVGLAINAAITTIENAAIDKVTTPEEIEDIKVKFEDVKAQLREASDALHGLLSKVGGGK